MPTTITLEMQQVLAAVLALMLAGCASAARTASPCAPLDPSRDGWVRHRATHFSFELPAEFSRTADRGIDSEVAEYVTPAASVGYDFGAYSNDLTDFDQVRIEQTCMVTLDSLAARFVTGRFEGDFFVAAHWPTLGGGPLGPAALTVHGFTKDSAAARTLHGVLRSVRFDSIARRPPVR